MNSFPNQNRKKCNHSNTIISWYILHESVKCSFIFVWRHMLIIGQLNNLLWIYLQWRLHTLTCYFFCLSQEMSFQYWWEIWANKSNSKTEKRQNKEKKGHNSAEEIPWLKLNHLCLNYRFLIPKSVCVHIYIYIYINVSVSMMILWH